MLGTGEMWFVSSFLMGGDGLIGALVFWFWVLGF